MKSRLELSERNLDFTVITLMSTTCTRDRNAIKIVESYICNFACNERDDFANEKNSIIAWKFKDSMSSYKQ